jgi:molybdopterin/thiamine biosynthesis adenylyltransferase
MSYLARSAIIGGGAKSERTPELHPLASKSVALFGLGCLGAPVALELARAGLGSLSIVDHDTVDPAASVRWPRGLYVAGQLKTMVIEQMIHQDYPYCKVRRFEYRVGSIRRPQDNIRSDQITMAEITSGASLLFDATAEIGVQNFLSDVAREIDVPYIGIGGTFGAWGGRVFRFRPRYDQGCFWCYCKGCLEGTIPWPSNDESKSGHIQPAGCADPTFTGANFDMMQIAMTGVRAAVSTLCSNVDGGYPPIEWDAVHIDFRNKDGKPIAPTFREFAIPKHPECGLCNGR